MSETNKAVVRRLVDEVMNAGNMDLIDEIYTPQLAPNARRWIAPFRESFSDVHLTIVDLITEGDKVVGRFTCSGTHRGTWRGHPPTGRRFHNIAEVYIFTIETAASPRPGYWRTRTRACSSWASQTRRADKTARAAWGPDG